MTSRITRITTCVAALALMAGIGAPAGFAMPAAPGSSPDGTSSQVRPAAVTPDEAGFDWSAAAIGGLATAGAGVAMIGIGRNVRRRHEPTSA